MIYKIYVSNGEILDKLTILSIKKNKITNKKQLKNINKEIKEIKLIKEQICQLNNHLHILYAKLLRVNKKLWLIEDNIRHKEKCKNFDNKFIELARQVYILNDDRADIKKQINIISKSDIVEEKSYTTYK